MAALKPLDTLKTPRESGLKLLEEASEACEAMKELEKASDAQADVDAAYARLMVDLRRQALLELADVLQVVCNCLHTLDAKMLDLEDAIESVQELNSKRGRCEVEGARPLAVAVGMSLADLYGILGEDKDDD